jgi:branched-chain amino acid transport system ATP-binding protein
MTPLLEVAGLTKRFGGLVAVSEVGFSMQPGDSLAIIGPNGAGKTTLLNLLAGIIEPTAGHVHFDGKETTGRPAHEMSRRGIARTSQVTRPFARLSVLENIMVGSFQRHAKPADAKESALRWLDYVGLEDKARRAARTLSTADRKRLEVARALATEPKLLLLDETFAGLNTQEIREALAWAGKLRSLGISLVMTEHIMEPILALSERMIVLDQGRVICDDVPESALRNARVQEAYLGSHERADS